MGAVPSCYPSKSHRRVNTVTQPFDTRRLLSELITVQTAIVLNEDAMNETAVLPPGVVGDDELGAGDVQPTPQLTPQRRSSVQRRRSVECTITSKTSLGFPGEKLNTTATTTSSDVSSMNSALEQAAELVGAHLTAHNRDVQKAVEEGKKMPSIKEMSEMNNW